MRVSIKLPDKDYQMILTQIMLACRGCAITIDYSNHHECIHKTVCALLEYGENCKDCEEYIAIYKEGEAE